VNLILRAIVTLLMRIALTYYLSIVITLRRGFFEHLLLAWECSKILGEELRSLLMGCLAFVA